MGIQRATNHDRGVLGTVWRPLDPRQLCSVPWISNRAAQTLDALGEEVDQLELLTGVLVEGQVELVEGRPRDVPVASTASSHT